MLIRFFFDLRTAGVPVSITELLSLLAALQARLSFCSAEEFYYLARLILVKDERYFDRFDRAFAEHFTGAEKLFERVVAELPADWLKLVAQRVLSEEERARIAALGSWEQLLQTLRDRLQQQKDRHEGGSKWIGTGGTSPFGSGGYNPEGIRIGPGGKRQWRAVKVWENREYRNLDDTVELGTRNLKLALRRLRKFARQGAADELDLEGTIAATARNAGWLDLKLVAERRNAVKVLLLLDVGGSMNDHVAVCEELFSAARGEFRHLEYFYFHNCPYDYLWKDNRRRQSERVPTSQLLRTFNADYRVIIVGDATMSPYEISQPGGSVEQWNEEAGAVWLQRLAGHFQRMAWLNPEPEERWPWTPSVRMIQGLLGGRMFPLTLAGLDLATAALRRREPGQGASRPLTETP